MKLTKSRLRKLILEEIQFHQAQPTEMSGPEIPTTEPLVEPPAESDYEMVYRFLEDNPDLVMAGLELLMDMSGSGCPFSTAQAVVDYLNKEGLAKS